MKLKIETLRKLKSSNRGRKAVLYSAKRFNFHLPEDEKEAMLNLIARGKSLKVKYTLSYILREGAKLLIKEQSKILDKAEAGELHAKPRKDSPIKLFRQQIRKTT